MRTFACVLHYSENCDYVPNDVLILQSMVEKWIPSVDRFVCFSNLQIDGVETIPLELGLTGKHTMMEVFRLPGPVMVTGLDTIFLNNVDRVFDVVETSNSPDFWLIQAFNKYRTYANGIMAWNGDWSKLIYNYNIKLAMDYRLEQMYTIEKLHNEKANIKLLNDVIRITSFKQHLKMNGDYIPKQVDVVLFHGEPRPSQVKLPWVKELYAVCQ